MSKGFNGFLIPEDNKRDIPDQENGKKYLFVSSVEDAWRKVTGVGINRKTIRLPEEIERLHILVGDSPQPVLSVILLLNPKKVFLWTSERTRDVGKQIQEVFKHSRELSIKFGDIQEMDSHDIQKAYTDLDEMIKNGGQKQIISCTGGNRLMGFAALLVAQTRRLPVVYRDLQAAKNTLTGFSLRKINVTALTSPSTAVPLITKSTGIGFIARRDQTGILLLFFFYRKSQILFLFSFERINAGMNPEKE